MKLIQIPFSHNCVKVRVALERKHLAFDVDDVKPTDRAPVFAASGQGLVPVLVDGTRTVADSTAILLYLEERYPDPSLVPADPAGRAECLVLEDWADRALMELSRRLAYRTVLSSPETLGRMFFPKSSGLKRRVQVHLARKLVAKRFRIKPDGYTRDVAEARRVAALAIGRLGKGPYLLGETLTIADIALASMAAPFAVDAEVRQDAAVAALLTWGEPIVGRDVVAFYRGDGSV